MPSEEGAVIIVIDGVVGTQNTLTDGRQTITAYYTRGDIVDLRGAATHMHAHLIALTRAQVCRVETAAFQSVLESNHEACFALTSKLREQISLMGEHAADLGKKQSIERLASFLLECHIRSGYNDSKPAKIAIPMPRISLADYMALQPETVSRCMRQLEDMKLIETSAGNLVTIRDLVRLKELAAGGSKPGLNGAIER